MKRKLALGLGVVGAVSVGGVAWAMLGGIVTVPNIAQGVATGGGANGCQTSSVNFTVPTPTWNNSINGYSIDSIGYSGVTSACVTLGTADLIVNVVVGSQSVANGTSTNMGSTAGTINLSSPVEFDAASAARYEYLVRDN